MKKLFGCLSLSHGLKVSFFLVLSMAASPAYAQTVQQHAHEASGDGDGGLEKYYKSNKQLQGQINFEDFKRERLSKNSNKTTATALLWPVIQNDVVKSMCGGGTFEDSTLQVTEWSGGYGAIVSNGGTNDPLLGDYISGFVPTANSTINAPLTSSCGYGNAASNHALENHHTVVRRGNDPLVGSLLMTTPQAGNNYAFRLGNSCLGYGIDYLSKKLVVAGSGIIKFSYALVMDGIHTPTDNPSFWVKVLDNNGNEITNVVYLDPVSGLPMDHVVSSSTDPFFQHMAGGINFRDWTCATIDLGNYIGQTVSVVLVTTDCDQGGHWGYAYMDDWCGNCAGSTTGTLVVDAADSCISHEMEIDASYTLPVIGSTTGTATIDLLFYQNGTPISYTLTSPVLTADGTHHFLIDSTKLPCNGTGYDVVARINYTILSSTYTLYYPDPMSVEGIKPGLNNDLVCCVPISEICSLTNARLLPSAAGGCCYQLQIRNNYNSQYFSGVSITSSSLSISSVSSTNTWSTIAYQDPQQVIFEKTSSFGGIPADTGWQNVGLVCFAGTGLDNITVDFIGPAPDYDTICEKILPIQGCGVPVDTSCTGVVELKTECVDGIVKMKFKITNNANFTMRGITLYPQNPNVVPSPAFIPIADLLPGQTSGEYETTLLISGNDTNACFFFAACDQNTVPGDHGQYPDFCCMDSISYCVPIPSCNLCDAIIVNAVKENGPNCCYKLTLINNYNTGNLKCVRFKGHSGAQFALMSGWTIQPPVSSNKVTMCAPGGTIQQITYTDFASFCLTGTSVPPHSVTVEFLDDNDSVVCIKELSFDSCTLVPPTCANITNDSLYCEGKQTKYSFHVQNNSPFTIHQVEARISDTSIYLENDVIIMNPPIPPGTSGGPYVVVIDSGFSAGKDFCVYLSAHNAVYNADSGIAATQCCTDSLGVICLPYINCDSLCAPCDSTVCCDFKDLGVPTGLTPNNDAINETYDIQNSALCKQIKIVVFNRWGNIVYKDDNYTNNWKGTNNKGETLPQGTYFVVIELETGAKKGTYVDIRY